MKKILFILSLIATTFCGTTSVLYIDVFTLDRTQSVQFVAPVESAFVYTFKDDGITKIDSGYTDVFGRFRTNKFIFPSNYNRIHVSKSGYSTEWTRYSLSSVDSLGDTLIIPHRVFISAPVSTYSLTMRLINMSGQPKTNTLVKIYFLSAPNGFTGSDNEKYFVTPTLGTGLIYEIQEQYTNSSGIVEFDILQDAIIAIEVNKFFVSAFRMTGNLDLDTLQLRIN